MWWLILVIVILLLVLLRVWVLYANLRADFASFRSLLDDEKEALKKSLSDTQKVLKKSRSDSGVQLSKQQELVSKLKEENSQMFSMHQELLSMLKRENAQLISSHEKELSVLEQRLQNSSALQIQSPEFYDIMAFFAWYALCELPPEESAALGIPSVRGLRPASRDDPVAKRVIERFSAAFADQYKYQYLTFLYPELAKIFRGTEVLSAPEGQPTTVAVRSESVFAVVDLLRDRSALSEKLYRLENRLAFFESTKSNLTAIPYMARIMADYETYDLERLASSLDWGSNVRRQQKVASIREIRRAAEEMVERHKEAEYQLAYLLSLFPGLSDVLDTEYASLPPVTVAALTDHDAARDYLSKEEYASLSTVERNQLALDRYKASHRKTKWQIGRDYELFIGHTYEEEGCFVDFFGSYMGLEDLGRDLIVRHGLQTTIVQCKYWSSEKQIHENHITQLYGTVASYCIEHGLPHDSVKGVLITNIELSPMAKKMAAYLGVSYRENVALGEYPMIKCNIGHDETGLETKIYHLPFDQQYDQVKIDKPGEFFAATVAEAEAAGFRRAYRWYGSD